MMRLALGFAFFLAIGSSAIAQSSSPAADRDWFIGMKKTAKQVRVALVTGRRLSSEEISAFSRDARVAMSDAEGLSLPPAKKAVCRDAASSLVDVVDTATYGSALRSEVTVSEHYARWERLGDRCLAAINGR